MRAGNRRWTGRRTSVQYRWRLSGQTGAMRFETKIAIAVREDLAVWQKLNVTAFLPARSPEGVPR